MLEIKAPLGKKTKYPTKYDAKLLCPIPREKLRANLTNFTPNFHGHDIFVNYEVSFLNLKGKPLVAIGRYILDAKSTCLLESKSLKLYFNSLNQHKFDSLAAANQRILQDLGQAAASPLQGELYSLAEYQKIYPINSISGICLDDIDISTDCYDPNPNFLESIYNADIVTETLSSNLLKSNCLITNQPDWGTIIIQYTGKKISHEGLLKYLISLRMINSFHENCVERIFSDISHRCQPIHLTVNAFYTRRGGIEINVCRSSHKTPPLVNNTISCSKDRMIRQ